MSLFQPVTTTQSGLEATSVANGKAYFVHDSERLFFDYRNVRTEIRDIIILDSEQDRLNQIAPKNKFYFVVETSVLWLYRLGDWIQVGAPSNVSVATEYYGGSGISSIQLSQEIPDISNILSINVDGILLMKNSCTLDSDGRTLRFSEELNPQVGLEVSYVVSKETQESNQVLVAESDLHPGKVYALAPSSATSLTFSGWEANTEGIIVLYLDVISDATVSLPSNIKWKNAQEPNLELNKSYILEFRSIDGGSTIYGSIDVYS